MSNKKGKKNYFQIPVKAAILKEWHKNLAMNYSKKRPLIFL